MVDPVMGDDAVEMVEHELAVLLRRARAFSGQFAREFHPDLDAGAYALMVWLDDVGSARLTDMATFFGVGKPTVSRQVQLLERLDLITRTTDDNDRRAQTLSLTADGAARLHLVRDARRGRFRTMLAPWPEPEVAALGNLLGRLNQAMGAPKPDEASADGPVMIPADGITDGPITRPNVIPADRTTDGSSTRRAEPPPTGPAVRRADGSLSGAPEGPTARPLGDPADGRTVIPADSWTNSTAASET
jgi:DNA-binding MarR family transcriptional regulator